MGTHEKDANSVAAERQVELGVSYYPSMKGKGKGKQKFSDGAAFRSDFGVSGLYLTRGAAEKDAARFRTAVDSQHARQGRGGSSSSPASSFSSGSYQSPVRYSNRKKEDTPEKQRGVLLAVLSSMITTVERRVKFERRKERAFSVTRTHGQDKDARWMRIAQFRAKGRALLLVSAMFI